MDKPDILVADNLVADILVADNLVADILVADILVADILVVGKLGMTAYHWAVRDIEVHHFQENFQENQHFLGEIAVDFLGDFED